MTERLYQEEIETDFCTNYYSTVQFNTLGTPNKATKNSPVFDPFVFGF